MQQNLLKYIYTVFLGILIVTFIGLGIDTFYPSPQYPDYPAELERAYYPDKDDGLSEEEIALQEEFDRKSEEFSQLIATYNRNVSIISLVSAVIILIISLGFSKKLDMLADGVLLGGILTLAYGIIRGFGADDPTFRFIVITVGLIVAIILGYIRFVNPTVYSKSS
ncbi:hypothetical protein KC573_01220 [candidate division WWE3 bacterium]|uniref:Uncharacterized protein n=1 Tax=candidate division WWE3 bacterium TaxID=2053526 RepID=A0A955RWT8_UNCKA|nr:hypothetical protein [candidate division WWE3 bacterium]